MKHTAIRLGAFGATVGTVGILAASGVASATPLNTNANQNTAQNGSAMANYMTGNQGNFDHSPAAHDRMGRLWKLLDPSKYMSLGQSSPPSFSSMANNEISNYINKIKTSWPTNNSDPTWMPSGTNWQSNWMNWNPATWEEHGSSYANWSNQLNSYLTTTYPGLSTELSTIGL
jgi:hypothetical protein